MHYCTTVFYYFRYLPENNPHHRKDTALQKLSIPAKNQKEIRVSVQNGQKLHWFIKSNSDFNFCVWLGENLIRPKFRIQTDFVPEFDEIHCEESGEAVLVFDNMFSTFSKKTVYYCVNVK